jgi:RimJ/RimL family protein N-acetyltransferase
MDVYLATERLELRPFALEDLDALEALDADPEVMRYINGGRPTSREELREDILPFWLGYDERGDAWGFWAAIERATGTFLGWWRVMEKAGMRFVRLFHGEWPDRIPGDEHGDVEYAITREDWAARNGLEAGR